MVDLRSIHCSFPMLISLPLSTLGQVLIMCLSVRVSMSPLHCHHSLVTMEPSSRAGQSEFFRLAFPFSSLRPLPNFSLAASVSYFAVLSMGETGVGPPLHTALFKI